MTSIPQCLRAPAYRPAAPRAPAPRPCACALPPCASAAPARRRPGRQACRALPAAAARAAVAIAALAGAALASGACLEPKLPEAPELTGDASARAAGPAAMLGEPSATDWRGAPRALDALPRVFRIRIAVEAPVAPGTGDGATARDAATAGDAATAMTAGDAPSPLDLRDGVLLLQGALDPDLAADLAAPPLRASTRARSVPATVRATAAAVEVAPLDARAPGEELLLVLAPWIRGPDGRALLTAPRVVSLRVSADPADGAALTETWPADGTPAVPAELAFAALRFDGTVRGARDAVFLAGPDGRPLGGAVSEPPCETLGWPGGHCVVLTPQRPLAPGAEHAVVVGEGLRDGTGAPLPTRLASFRTGAAGAAPASTPGTLPCALDETEVALGCLLAGDDRVVLRVRMSAPALLLLRAGEPLARAVAPRGDAELAVRGLAPDRALDLRLTAIGLAGDTHVHVASARTAPPLPRVSIVEVRADPRGPEPRQEYVELLNYGDVEVDLAGFTISDRADARGDVIAPPARVAPGARVLVVADAFDPVSTADDPVPPGVPLLRIGASIGAGGLANAGEPLFLRDPEGRRVSAAPALPPPREGACIVRLSDDPRAGDLAAFGADAAAGCTPGAPDRLPPSERRAP